MRRLLTMVAALVSAVVLAVGFASSAGAYGGGANHDMWQIGFSFNCNNPALCGDIAEGTGGDWGWVEFDRSADGTQTWGDAQSAFCFHTVGGGGAGAGHGSIEVTSWRIAAGSAGPQTFFASGTEADCALRSSLGVAHHPATHGALRRPDRHRRLSVPR